MTEWLSPITVPMDGRPVILLTRHKEDGSIDVCGGRFGKDSGGKDAWATLDWSGWIMEHPSDFNDIIGWIPCPCLGEVTAMKQPE